MEVPVVWQSNGDSDLRAYLCDLEISRWHTGSALKDETLFRGELILQHLGSRPALSLSPGQRVAYFRLLTSQLSKGKVIGEVHWSCGPHRHNAQ